MLKVILNMTANAKPSAPYKLNAIGKPTKPEFENVAQNDQVPLLCSGTPKIFATYSNKNNNIGNEIKPIAIIVKLS